MDISIENLIHAYSQGVFPMADEASGGIFWYSPNPRAIIPLDTYKPSKSLRPVINKGEFEIKVNRNFEQVMRACAQPRSDDDGVWISEDMISLYKSLHEKGLAHSVEAYKNSELVGGLYGVSLGSCFYGESMFYTFPNASKVAFHYLIERLKSRNFLLLDTQFINDNVKRFGAIEISQKKFLKLLAEAISIPNRFV